MKIEREKKNHSNINGLKKIGVNKKWQKYNLKTMSDLFCGLDFNGDISRWNVSNVKYMNCIFLDSDLKNKAPVWHHN